MRFPLRHDLEQRGRDDLPSVAEIQPLLPETLETLIQDTKPLLTVMLRAQGGL